MPFKTPHQSIKAASEEVVTSFEALVQAADDQGQPGSVPLANFLQVRREMVCLHVFFFFSFFSFFPFLFLSLSLFHTSIYLFSPFVFIISLHLSPKSLAPFDDDEAGGPAVVLSTIHAAKGLEYGCVFIPGLQDGLLPHERALQQLSMVGLLLLLLLLFF